MKYYLKCVTCSREFKADPRASTCPDCGEFKGTLDVVYPLDKLSGIIQQGNSNVVSGNIFKAYSDIFPFENHESMPPLAIGDTPLFRSHNLTTVTGVDKLWIKDDGRNPSASLKDRASGVAIAMAMESNAKVIAAASTGNAASSLATLAASIPLKTVVFVPRNIPRPKLTQLLIHGAEVLRLDCDYDKAFELCQQACLRFGWYNRNTAVNPFTCEGKKSVALEIYRDIKGPLDVIICPVGDGCIISGLYKGYSDMKGLGIVDKIPRLYGVQAEGSAPLAKAFSSSSDIEPLKDVATIADSIAVGYPRDGIKAIRAVSETGGSIIAVNDDEIMKAQKILASKAGVFAEPAASASYAGLEKLLEENSVDRNESIVLLITGHGLKDIEAAGKYIQDEKPVNEPNIESIEKEVKAILDTKSS